MKINVNNTNFVDKKTPQDTFMYKTNFKKSLTSTPRKKRYSLDVLT